MKKIYYIGGSPCSGKSTIAEMIERNYGFYYYKVDDYLEAYMAKGQKDKKPAASKISKLKGDAIWLRNPQVQNEEELAIYREFFEYIQEDLSHINAETIITEGAAYLPELMKQYGIDVSSYFCIVPEKKFQYENYKLRPYVPYILADCSDKELAFENWMERDALFAQYVKRSAEELGYHTIVTDGQRTIMEQYQEVVQAFHL